MKVLHEVEPELASTRDLAEPHWWTVPWTAKVPGAVLVAAMSAIWIASLPDGMTDWAVSAERLRKGQFEGIALHMFAHGPLFHIVFNMFALYALSGLVVVKLASWWRYLALFLASGLVGLALFLILHPMDDTPMLGASGAISGLAGLIVRFAPGGHELVAVRSAQVWTAIKEFVKENLLLIAMLTVPALLAGQSGGVAWEAHLGGFLLGLLLGPKFLPPSFFKGD